MDGEALGKALAFSSGDLRDWPTRCVRCAATDLAYNGERDQFLCKCGAIMTGEVAYEDRVARARREVLGRG